MTRPCERKLDLSVIAIPELLVYPALRVFGGRHFQIVGGGRVIIGSMR
jgi:hypothetical protein